MTYKDEFFPLEGTLFLEKCAALIKEERLSRKLRQQDICEMVNISLSTFKRLEQASPKVELGSFIKVLWYLNILDDISKVLPTPNKDIDSQRVRLKKISWEDF
ncbi:helix-turn-helix transcriptional regulator [Acinetobacter bereziniae]|uniref:helix-turn-helix transcriptional regulator n=1 Tax=Acinetobacter bereziniae TaxID=106648 RepID=UPI0012505952|nr:helix-turn-helix transcriptional regulator [Acinetobacter bereziniae]